MRVKRTLYCTRVEAVLPRATVMASGVNSGANNDSAAVKRTAHQLHPRTSTIPVTSVTGHGNRTVTLQVLSPSHFNVPPASASADITTARLLTTQLLNSQSANIQVRQVVNWCNYDTLS